MTTKATCSVEGCERAAIARGWCPSHYGRWREHGDPLKGAFYKSPSDLPDSILSRYVTDLWSMIQIAKEHSCSTYTVDKRLRQLGVAIRPRSAGSPRYKTPQKHFISEDVLRDLYVTKRMSSEDIGKQFGCSMPTVLTRLREVGIEIRAHGEHRKGQAPHNVKTPTLSDEQIVDLYLSRDDMTRGEVCLAASCTMRRLNSILRACDVEIKSYAQVLGEKNSGANNKFYNSNLSQFDRERLRKEDCRTVRWRKAVYNRDNFTCLKCEDATGGNLNAHHLEAYNSCYALRWEVSNGVTLCEPCHVAFHKRFGFGNNTAAQFAEFMTAERLAA